MAIAYDNSSQATSGGGASSLTYSHTVGTGDDRILFVYTVNHHTLGSITGVTYGGVAMTLIVSDDATANHGQEMWYLVAPATGANNVVVSKSDGSGWIDSTAASYEGASQTGVPDAYVVPSEATTTSYARSLTTVADNTWITWGMCAFSGATLTAGSNTIVRKQQQAGYFSGMAYCDTNADQTPAGSKTMTVTSTSQGFCSIMASFAPVGGEGGSTSDFFQLLI